MMFERREAQRQAVLARVLRGPGETTASYRESAAADGQALPPDLKAFALKVQRTADRITDDEVAALRATHSDDVLFEVATAAAMGAANARLVAGLSNLEDDDDATQAR
jgi:hypothetical protein